MAPCHLDRQLAFTTTRRLLREKVELLRLIKWETQMTILAAMCFGILGAVAGFMAGGAAAAGYASAVQMTTREGAAGYFTVAIGILAGLAGMVAAMVLTLRWRGVTGGWMLFGGTLASITGIVLLAAGSIGLYWVGT